MSLRRPSESQSRIIWCALTALALAAIVAVIVGFIRGFGVFVNLLSQVLWPLAIATVLAYLLDPAVNRLEQEKIPRTWGIVIVFVSIVCIAGGILAVVMPPVIQETSTLISKIPDYTGRVQRKLEKWTDNPGPSGTQTHPAGTNAPPEINAANQPAQSARPPAGAANIQQIRAQIISTAKGWLGTVIPKIGDWFLRMLGKATSLMDVAIAAILIPIYTFYFLREKHEIQRLWPRYLPIRDSRAKEELVFIISAINQYMIAFFRGQVIVALVSGALYTIGFLAIGLDYAFLFGFAAVILVIIPVVGATILGVLVVVFTAVQFHDWLHPLAGVLLFAVVQSLESFFYAPRIMGNRVGLHPVVVIIALMAGLTLLGGLLGGILAIPLAAALRVILFRYVWEKNEAG